MFRYIFTKKYTFMYLIKKHKLNTKNVLKYVRSFKLAMWLLNYVLRKFDQTSYHKNHKSNKYLTLNIVMSHFSPLYIFQMI